LSSPIQRRERVIELAHLGIGLRDETKPLGIEQATAGRAPGGETGAKLADPFHVLAEADQSAASAQGCIREPLRQAIFARDFDRRLHSRLRHSELASEVVQNRREVQREGETVDMRELSAEGERSFHRL
jgi:hypothetical protein